MEHWQSQWHPKPSSAEALLGTSTRSVETLFGEPTVAALRSVVASLLAERLLQVGDQVVDIFDPDR
jgi:hypothetical protein